MSRNAGGCLEQPETRNKKSMQKSSKRTGKLCKPNLRPFINRSKDLSTIIMPIHTLSNINKFYSTSNFLV